MKSKVDTQEELNKKQLWEIANPIGRPAKFKSAKQLWDGAKRYFAWADANPIKVNSKQSAVSKRKGRGDEKGLSKSDEVVKRPYTLSGLSAFLGISAWHTFKYNQLHRKTDGDDFQAVILYIEEIIETQQVEGGLVGLYNSNLTARLNGIKDNQDVTSGGEQIIKSKEQIMKELEELRSKTGGI